MLATDKGVPAVTLTFDNSQQWLTEVRKELYYDYSFILTKDTKNQPKVKTPRARSARAANTKGPSRHFSVQKNRLSSEHHCTGLFVFRFHYVGMIEWVIAQCPTWFNHQPPSLPKSQTGIMVAQSTNPLSHVVGLSGMASLHPKSSN